MPWAALLRAPFTDHSSFNIFDRDTMMKVDVFVPRLDEWIVEELVRAREESFEIDGRAVGIHFASAEDTLTPQRERLARARTAREVNRRRSPNPSSASPARATTESAPVHGPRPRRAAPARRLCDAERAEVLAVLHEPRFADLAPAQVQAALLEENRYDDNVERDRTERRGRSLNFETRCLKIVDTFRDASPHEGLDWTELSADLKAK
jgi:hypothetical protein